MVTSEELSSLVTGLHAARHFEQAALITLRALLLIAEQALEASPFARKGRILRGVVHLRPADAYRRLVALGRDAVETWPPSEQALLLADGPQVSLLASASAWRAVVEHGCAVSIDVGLGTLQPHQDSAARVSRWKRISSSRSSSNRGRRHRNARRFFHSRITPSSSPAGWLSPAARIPGSRFPAAFCRMP